MNGNNRKRQSKLSFLTDNVGMENVSRKRYVVLTLYKACAHQSPRSRQKHVETPEVMRPEQPTLSIWEQPKSIDPSRASSASANTLSTLASLCSTDSTSNCSALTPSDPKAPWRPSISGSAKHVAVTDSKDPSSCNAETDPETKTLAEFGRLEHDLEALHLLTDDTPMILDDNEPRPYNEQLDMEHPTEGLPVSFDLTLVGDVLTETESTKYFEELREKIRISMGSEWAEIDEFLRTPYGLKDAGPFNRQFEEFRRQESVQSGWDPALLVSPSGDPSQQMHLKLNYPTFRTQRLEYGESADDTNSSTRLLMRKGLAASNAFWFEYVS